VVAAQQGLDPAKDDRWTSRITGAAVDYADHPDIAVRHRIGDAGRVTVMATSLASALYPEPSPLTLWTAKKGTAIRWFRRFGREDPTPSSNRSPIVCRLRQKGLL
jgi:hypothetical protein